MVVREIVQNLYSSWNEKAHPCLPEKCLFFLEVYTTEVLSLISKENKQTTNRRKHSWINRSKGPVKKYISCRIVVFSSFHVNHPTHVIHWYKANSEIDEDERIKDTIYMST